MISFKIILNMLPETYIGTFMIELSLQEVQGLKLHREFPSIKKQNTVLQFF